MTFIYIYRDIFPYTPINIYILEMFYGLSPETLLIAMVVVPLYSNVIDWTTYAQLLTLILAFPPTKFKVVPL